jgi:hypothetical protein
VAEEEVHEEGGWGLQHLKSKSHHGNFHPKEMELHSLYEPLLRIIQMNCLQLKEISTFSLNSGKNSSTNGRNRISTILIRHSTVNMRHSGIAGVNTCYSAESK